MPEEYERALVIASSFVDEPLRQFREWVGEVVAETDQLPARLRDEDGEPFTLTLRLVLSIEEGVEDALMDEIDALL